MFIGKYNQHTRKREGGIVNRVYHDIILDTLFHNIIRVSLILYIAFAGFNLLRGTIKISQKELLTRLFKMSFVLALVSPNGWDFFDRYVMQFFINGVGNINSSIADIADVLFTDYGEYVF